MARSVQLIDGSTAGDGIVNQRGRRFASELNRRRRKNHALSFQRLENRRVLAAPGPEIVSILRTDTDPTNAEQVGFAVNFDEDVLGVDATDFTLEVTGLSGASIESITGNGSAYVVLVNTGAGEGTLKLHLVDDDSILDTSGRPLGGFGVGNGDFGGSTIVQIERDPRRTVTGVVFDDVNNNGVRDPGEPGAENAGVFLDFNQNGFKDSSEPEIRTPFDDIGTQGIDEGGVFTFTDVPLGTFDVVVRDFWFSYLSSPDHLTTVELGFHDDPLVIDVPATRNRTAVTGVVFNDFNQNGVRDQGDTGIAGQRIYRDSNGNDVFDSFETNFVTLADDPQTPEDETGSYEITPVPFNWDPLSSDFFTFRIESDSAWIATSPVETGRL